MLLKLEPALMIDTAKIAYVRRSCDGKGNDGNNKFTITITFQQVEPADLAIRNLDEEVANKIVDMIHEHRRGHGLS